MIVRSILLVCCLVLVPPARGHAADASTVEQMFLAGDYEQAAALAREELAVWNERWPRILLQSQLATGDYAAAKQTYDDAIARFPTSLTLRMLGLEVLRHNGLDAQADAARKQILQLLQTSPSRFSSRDNLIAAGRYFAMRGEDARQILQHFYDRVRDADPTFLESYIATAELAIAKGDFQVAAETLRAADQYDNRDPRVPYLSARAWESSDPEKASAALRSALQRNPRHVPSLLMKAEAAIDREQYDAASDTITEVLKINPHQQEAWALLAVLAHLRGQYEIEPLMRAAALSTWSTNPRVDHLIGTKLSQKYRFKEGSQYQWQALQLDPVYWPASFQLAQDLLRLGNDEIGWKLAQDVATDDQYNVVAHNLMLLHDRIKDFAILEADGIVVRMQRREAAIYGDAVLRLLQDAKSVLCDKYNVQPQLPIVVEIFPEQKDFAIRTFGLPGGAGFLGVCFGRVITANSPASQGPRPANWQSVLWHEFCHVVTLEKTNNRMPRWLSEGISVYEERQRDPSWGESISPTYRRMMLGEELTPVSDLSAAFLNPPSPLHLQFAYYESSLVVEFLIEKYGLDALRNVLDDLAAGLTINDALTRHAGSLDKLNVQFTEYAHRVANEFGRQADWRRETLPEDADIEQLANFVQTHPTHYWALRTLSERYVAADEFEKAKPLLEKLRELGAVSGERDGPLELLARVYRELGQTDDERTTLQQLVATSSDALPALQRLIELARQEDNWDLVSSYAQQANAIHPLLTDNQATIATAAEQLQQPELAVTALRALAEMDPIDPAGLNYRLAKSLADQQQYARAKHHVLRALADAPRYRDAHRLLLELSERKLESSERETSDLKQEASP